VEQAGEAITQVYKALVYDNTSQNFVKRWAEY